MPFLFNAPRGCNLFLFLDLGYNADQIKGDEGPKVEEKKK